MRRPLWLTIILLLAASVASASPWADAGDGRFRNDVEVLAAFGLLDGPVITWPLPMAQLQKLASIEASADAPAHVRASLRRVQARLADQRHKRRFVIELSTAATSEPRVVRYFDDPVRRKLDAVASVHRAWRSSFVKLGVGYQGDDGGELVLDGSYLSQTLGNWILYGGLVDHWWGSGWGNSLILSNNARPFPKVGLIRGDTRPFSNRWLRWIGPWRLNTFFGVFDESGRAVSSPLVIGFRWTMTPIARLELGFTRAIMICGDGRPCDGGTWFDAVFPFNNAENVLTDDNPSNQLAGFDLRYTRRFGGGAMSIYGQYFGEDEQDNWIRTVIGLFGLSADGPLGGGGAHWRVVTEYSDTSADSFEDRRNVYNVVYEHRIYESGYRYRERAVGHALDGDGRLVSMIARITDARARSYSFSYHYARVNRDNACVTRTDGECSHTVSATAEHINILEVGAKIPTRAGEFELDLRFEDDQPATPGVDDREVDVRFMWRRSF